MERKIGTLFTREWLEQHEKTIAKIIRKIHAAPERPSPPKA